MLQYVRVLLILSAAAALLAQPARADTITIGSSAGPVTSGYCVPFGCSPGSRFQQVLTSAFFPGVFDITGLDFFNTLPNSGGDQYIDPAHYTISLSTTAAAAGALNTSDFDANLGLDTTVVFSGELGASPAGEVPPGPETTLPFTWSTPFRFDPLDGNLLIDIRKTGGTFFGDDGTYLDFMEPASGGISTVSDFTGADYWNNRPAGLVVRFTGTLDSDAAPVPEPGTLLLLGAGLARIALRVSRHRGARATR